MSSCNNTATGGWSSPRDGCPSSVHDLMSLWGGFDQPSNGDDNGLEKRLELDFASPLAVDDALVAALCRIIAVEDGALQTRGKHTLTFPQTLVVLGGTQWILSAASSVMLHRVLHPILALLRDEYKVTVSWASFFRKNTDAPWGSLAQTGGVMASEYADLKCAFPAGQSFLTGPVDGDHYFHFVYDNMPRESDSDNTEQDVQLNVFLYDVEGASAEKCEQHVTALDDGRYEVLRAFADVPHISFETNSPAAVEDAARCQQLLGEHKPQRFTVVALQDRDVDASTIRRTFSAFEGYALQHRSVNYLREGYAFHQVVFVRAE